MEPLLAVTPIVGRPLFSLLAAYSLLPATTSLKASHGYSTGRAVLTWFMPILLNIVVVYGVAMMLISNAVRNVLSESATVTGTLSC
jgi:hypothetical protein